MDQQDGPILPAPIANQEQRIRFTLPARGFSHIHVQPRSQVLSRSVGTGRTEPWVRG